MECKRIISSIGMAAILLSSSVPVSAMNFTDVKQDASYIDSVNDMVALGIMQGDKGKFRPNDNVKRSEAAKVLEVSLGYTKPPKLNSNTFCDVKKTAWYKDIAYFAEQLKLIQGSIKNGKKYFQPDGNVTYAQFAAMAIRMLGYQDSELTGKWPDNYMKKAEELGLFKGILDNKTINEAQSAKGAKSTNNIGNVSMKRSEVAIMIDNTLNNLVKGTANTFLDKVKDKLSLKTITGIITDTPEFDSTLKKNQIKIDNQLYTIKSTSIDELVSDVGKKISGYVKDGLLISFSSVEGKTVSLTTSRDLQDDGIIYYKDPTGIEQSYTVDKNVKICMSGKNSSGLTDIKAGSQVTLIDNNDDSNYDYIITSSAETKMTLVGKVISITPASGDILAQALINGQVYNIKSGVNVQLDKEQTFIIDGSNTIISAEESAQQVQNKVDYGFISKVDEVEASGTKCYYADINLLNGTNRNLSLLSPLALKECGGKLVKYTLDAGNMAQITVLDQSSLIKSDITKDTKIYMLYTNKDGSFKNVEAIGQLASTIKDGAKVYAVTKDANGAYDILVVVNQ